MNTGTDAAEQAAAERLLNGTTGTTDAAAPEAEPAEEEFAVVEVFGHRRLWGRVLEVERFGAKFLRIDIPAEGGFAKGYTSQLYGGSSIFSFTPSDRATVERANRPYHAARPLIGHDDDDDDVGDDPEDAYRSEIQP